MKGLKLLFVAGMFAMLAGCQSVYYKTMDAFGKEKRDLLKSRVQEARDEQQKTAEQFKDALTRLRELYGSSGSDLEKMYDRMKSEYDSSKSRADSVTQRIDKMDRVARDLFKEWEQEIGNISNANYKSDSRSSLRETQQKFDELSSSMRRAETSLKPVLTQLNDQVLYLKHNLNAQALGTLKAEAGQIEKEIQRLIQDMNAAISQADSFIRTLK